MNRLAHGASAAAVLLTIGCGGPPPATTEQPQPTASIAHRNQSAELIVTQQGTSPARILWYLRVEDATAKPLLEKAYPGGKISLTQSFEPGAYRVMAWSRPCSGDCPTKGEDGLGPLKQVCGAKVDLAKGDQAKATAVIRTDGTCSVKVNS